MTYLANHNLVINVKDNPYNAKGDGTTDDTTAIQNAINAGVGRIVYFPNGQYKITSTITIANTSLRLQGEYGEADGGAAFFWAGPAGNGTVGVGGSVGNGSTMFLAYNISECVFDHLTFVGVPTLGSLFSTGAQYLFWIRTPLSSPGAGSTEVVEFNRCHFEAAYGPGSACLVIGDTVNSPGGGDIAEVRCNECEFVSGSHSASLAAPNVSAASDTTPIQITTLTAHGLTEGQAVVVRGVLGNTAANQAAFVHVLDTLNFQMLGTIGTGTYSGGGVVYQGGTFTTSDTALAQVPIPTAENGVVISNGGNTKNFSFTNCTWRNFLKAGVFAKENSGSLTFYHPTMGFSNGFSGLIADFNIAPLQNLTIIGAETEGSARAVHGLIGGNTNPATCVLSGYSWNGYSVDYTGDPTTSQAAQDISVLWGGQLIMTGCQFYNFRNSFTAVPYICPFADTVGVGVVSPANQTSLTSIGNFFNNATFLPFFDGHPTTGGNNLVDWQDFVKGGSSGANNNCPVVSRGDLGGNGTSGIIHFPPYEGMDLRVGSQQLLVQLSSLSFNTPNFSKINSGVLSGSYAKFSVDFTDFQTAAPSIILILGFMPARCRIINVIAHTTTPYSWTSGSDTITLSVGFTEADTVTQRSQAFLLAHDVKTAAVIKGTLAVDLGDHLDATVGNAFGYLSPSSWAGQLELNAVMTSGAQNLTGLNAGHTDIYVKFEVLPK